MTIHPFNDAWTVERDGLPPAAVTLPHDAMIAEPRRADAATGSAGAYFPGGRYVYRRRWVAPDDVADRHIVLHFGGVYRSAIVRVNGIEVARNGNGFLSFDAVLDDAVRPGENSIEVVADNSEVPNSRWYTGSGIYRPVWLELTGTMRFAPDGVRVVTRHLEAARAEVDVTWTLDGPWADGMRIDAELSIDDLVVARAESGVAGADGVLTLEVPDPRPWSAETPDLYDLRVRVLRGAESLHEHRIRVGLRTVAVEPGTGLLVNGRRTLLRGAAIHSDNGVLGAGAFLDAERRRVAIMKAAGYNAIRTAHNPASAELLAACDELGMYVVDEYTDVWWGSKSRYDDSATFDADWRDDLAGIVRKDRNHPSVIMYSIGNENGETGTRRGVQTARDMVALLHEIDPGRPVTAGVNIFLNVIGARSDGKPAKPTASAREDKGGNLADSTLFNALVFAAGPLMLRLGNGKAGDRASRGVFDALDVAGYNYAHGRFRGDAAAYPDRIILATESMPGDLPRIWAHQDLPGFIGDVVWTGWDYLGETGLGAWMYGKRLGRLSKPYPYIASGSGTIDLAGDPGAGVLLGRAVWGLADAPAITVRPLATSHLPYAGSMWRPSDAVPSWAWRGFEGKAAHVEVYAADDEVELFHDGSSVGRRPAGAEHGFVARFRLPYQPGELTAVGYRNGQRTGCSSLRSAGPATLRLTPESPTLAADPQALLYVRVDLADADGQVESAAADEIEVEIDGPGELAGFGSAAYQTEGSFVDAVHDTWLGRALLVVRSTGDTGVVTIRARSRRHGSAEIAIDTVRTMP